jgi:MFS family permease
MIAGGSVLGSFFAERVIRTIGRSRTLALSIPAGALMVGAPALTADPYLIAVAFFLGGTTNMFWNVVAVSLRQRLTPDRLLGRVNSAYRLLAWGVMPVGAAVGGILAQVLGLRAVFAVMAVLMLGILLGLRVVTDDRMAEAERQIDHRAEHPAEQPTEAPAGHESESPAALP